MTRHALSWRIIFAITFVLALAMVGYFAEQSEQSDSSPPAGFLAADKGYGVTIDLTRYDDDQLADTLAVLRQNELLWLRQPILWSAIEPAPGQFNWTPVDRIFAAIDQNNLEAGESAPNFKLIAVLHTSPKWARPAHAPATAPPVDISDFGYFARAFAGRYGHQLAYYQIWHEPNLSATWGRTYVDASAYATMLREAALNIRTVDADALILSAALAPTLENGPLNLNEIEYLDQLYRIKANRWFDVVAGQPYGFDLDPSDPAKSDALNFKRLELLRQVMLNYGDANTPIWATAFGWNVLPATWNGRPPPWRTDSDRIDPPGVQIQRTVDGIEQARQNWPWLGPMLAVRWDSTGLDVDDPAHGFALSETPLQEIFRTAATAPPIAAVGRYPADHPSGRYSHGWRAALTTADIPRAKPRTLTIPFDGTRLDLMLNRGPYRGYLWVTVDGQPANALPQNNQGRSYIVLYDPLRQPATVTVAQNLSPGIHQVVIEAEGGWGQWALSGWVVSTAPENRMGEAGLMLAGALAALSSLGLSWQFWPQLKTGGQRTWTWSWLKLSRLHASAPSEPMQIAVIFVLAFAFYFSPAGVAMILLIPLTLAIFYRPDLGLALIAFSLSFFQAPKPLPTGPFLLTETTLFLTATGFALRGLICIFSTPQIPTLRLRSGQVPNLQPFNFAQNKSLTSNLQSLDWAALALLILGLMSTLAAPNFGVSMFEWRALVFGSALYYFLVRLGSDYGPSASKDQPVPRLRWAWRLIDAVVAGAALHSALALYYYFWMDQFVVAEGVRRAVSPVYGSPNNLALFLDRVWPILAAVTILPPRQSSNIVRRWLYGIGLIVVSAALYLTFSKGALLVGLPTGVVAMALFYLLRHRGRYWGKIIVGVAGSLGVIILALIPLSQTERFRVVFNLSPGSTGFFRLKLWQASLNMLSDYWPLGVGLNNFLYQYRTRYMLPEAWQEPNLSHPHNLILDYGTRLGIGGVVILCWLQGAFWINARRLYQKLPEPFVLGLMGSMAVFLSHGLIDNSYFLVDLAFIFFLTTGLAQRLAEQERVSGKR